MIQCPYCNKMVGKVVESEQFKAPFLDCDNCGKTFLYKPYNYSPYNVWGVKIIEGIEMENIIMDCWKQWAYKNDDEKY